MSKKALALVAMIVSLGGPARSAETTGAGSTFVYPVLAKWAADYRTKTGNTVKYQAVGSGMGISQIKGATVEFGATDMPLKPEELDKLGLGQFPIVIGGVVPVVNIDGVKPGEVRFSGELLANIFLGKIRMWNDPAIQKLNPDLKLPKLAITVVHRSDGSGTTFNFANYLSKVSPEWSKTVGEGAAVEWPTGLGGKGNEGVAELVQQTNGSIGYVEYAYVLNDGGKMSYGLVQNSTGQFIKPDADSFEVAATTADWTHAKDFFLIMTDEPGERAYPITATSFVLMHKQAKKPEGAAVAMDFFKWSLENGQKQAGDLHYVPVPSNLVQQIEAYWKAQFVGWKE